MRVGGEGTKGGEGEGEKGGEYPSSSSASFTEPGKPSRGPVLAEKGKKEKEKRGGGGKGKGEEKDSCQLIVPITTLIPFLPSFGLSPPPSFRRWLFRAPAE